MQFQWINEDETTSKRSKTIQNFLQLIFTFKYISCESTKSSLESLSQDSFIVRNCHKLHSWNWDESKYPYLCAIYFSSIAWQLFSGNVLNLPVSPDIFFLQRAANRVDSKQKYKNTFLLHSQRLRQNNTKIKEPYLHSICCNEYIWNCDLGRWWSSALWQKCKEI